MSQQNANAPVIRLLNAGLLGKRLMATTAMTFAGVLAMTSSAYAVGVNETPTGGSVVAGSSTITYGTGSMTVNQTSDRSVIDWNTYNIGQDASATYNMPTSTSLSVNRVTGQDPSQILGTLKSNGRIMILDPNGVFFSKTATIDVGGIIASTGTLDQANQAQLMAGNKFDLTNVDANPNAQVSNAGNINVSSGGLVAFVAPWVSNSGYINAKLGKVTLAAGSKVTVDLAGDDLISIAVGDKLQKALVENSGTIAAQGGHVVMSANAAKGVVDTVVNMSGVIQVNSVSQKGGKIVLSGGSSSKVKVAGKMDASGKTGGGSVKVTGSDVEVADTAEIHADATDTGNGGDISLIAEQGMVFKGLLTATGGANGGNGGNAEVSGLGTLGYNGLVDLSAVKGQMGDLTLDPTFAIINSGSVPAGWLQDYVISAAALALSLANANVVISATNYIDVGTKTGGYGNEHWTGNVVLDALITAGLNSLGNGAIDLSTWHFFTASGTTNGTLTLSSAQVNINRALTMGNGDLNINAANDINWKADVTMAGGGDITAIAATAGQTFTNDADITTSGDVKLKAKGNVSLSGGSSVKTTGGNITIDQDGTLTAEANSIINTSAAGTINLRQNSGASLQNAIDAISNSGTGLNTLAVGAGNYAGGVNVDVANLDIYGSNTNQSITTGQPRPAGSTVGGTDYAFNVTGNNVTLHGFETTATIKALNANGLTITNNIVTGTTGDGIDVDGGKNVAVTLNALNNNADDAINIKNTTGITTVDINAIQHAGKDGIRIDHAEGLTVYNNVVAANGTGAGAGEDGIAVSNSAGAKILQNAVIAGSTVGSAGAPDAISADAIGAKGVGINVSGSNGVTLDNNMVSAGNLYLYTPTAPTATVGTGSGSTGISVTNSAGATLVQNFVTGTSLAGTFDTSTDPLYTGLAHLTKTNTGSHGSATTNGDGIKVTASAGSHLDHNNVYDTKSTSDNNGSGINVIDSADTSVNASYVDNTAWDGIRVVSSSDSTLVTGDSITNNSVSNVTRVGIYARSTDGLQVSGNWAVDTHMAGYGGISTDFGANYNIHDNTVVNSDGSGIRLYDATGANTISGNHIDGTALSGIVGDGTANMTISGNFIGLNGGNVKGDGVNATGLTAGSTTGNQIAGVAGNGINLTNASGYSISGNTITGAGVNGIFLNGGTGLNVDNNTITASGLSGIELSGVSQSFIGTGTKNTIDGQGVSTDSGIRLDGSNGITVSNNVISNTQIDGIRTFNSSGLTATNNTISGVKGSGIGIASSDGATLTGNHISDVLRGVWVGNSDNAKITGNDVTDASTYGVYVTNEWGGSSDGTVIAGNTLTGGEYGVYVQNGSSDNTTIGGAKAKDGNTITGASIDGVYAGGVSNVTIANNTITSSGDDGIDVDNVTGTVDISKNTVDGTSAGQDHDGIEVAGTSNASISGNTVKNAAWDGINVQQSAGTTIAGNHIFDTKGASGIAVVINQSNGAQSSDITIKNNDVHNSQQYGMYLGGTTGSLTVKGNTVDGVVQHDGIYVTDNAQNPTLTGNIIDNVAHDGIAINGSGSAATVKGNFIGTNGAAGSIGNNGVSVMNSGASTINGNTVANTAANGIYLDPSDGSTIAGNTVTGAGANGIFVDGDSNVTVGGNSAGDKNTVTGSTGFGVKVRGGTGNTVKGNTLTGNTAGGIGAVSTDGIKIAANTITGGAFGIYASGLTGTTGIANNSVDQSGTGILVEGSSNVTIGKNVDTVAGHQSNDGGNTVTNSGGNGIQVNGGSNNTIANNSVDGSGWDNINLQQGDHATVSSNKLTNANGASGIAVIGTSDATLSNNTIDGAKRLGVYAEFANGLQVLSNTISNVGKEFSSYTAFGSGVAVEASDDVTVNGNTITNATGDGVSIGMPINTSASGVTNATVDGNTIRNTGGAGVKATGGMLSASGNTINISAADGINIAGSNGVKVDDNKIGLDGGVTGDGIYVTTSDNAKIQRNDIANTVSSTGNKGSGIQLTDSSNATIGGTEANANTITSTGWDGVRVAGGSDVTVKNNTITDVARTGVYLGNVAGSTTAKNTITNAEGYYGVDVDGGSNATVSANTIDGANLDGIIIHGTGGTNAVTGNTVDNVNGNGINALSTAALTIRGNKVGLNGFIGSNGIQLLGSDDALIDSNTVVGAGADGIRVADGSDNVTIHKNDVSQATRSGVYVGGANGSAVSDNTITGAQGYDGIDIDGGTNTSVTINHIDGTNLDGIFIHNVGSVDGFVNTAAGNVIKNTGLSGIELLNTDGATLSGNTIKKAGWDGIRVADGSDDVTVSGNDIRHVTRTGIYVGGANGSAVTGNTIKDAQNYHGIDVDGGSDATVTGNNVNKTALDGIYLHGVSGTNGVGLNLVRNAGVDGIAADGASNLSIIGNYVDTTGQDGISVANSADANIVLNLLHEAGRDGIHLRKSDGSTITLNVVAGLNDGYGAHRDGINVGNSGNVDITNNAIIAGTVSLTSPQPLFAANDIEGSNEGEGQDEGQSSSAYGAGRDGIHVANSDVSYIDGNLIAGGNLAINLFGTVIDGGEEGGMQPQALVSSEGNGTNYGAGRNGILVKNGTGATVTNNVITGGNATATPHLTLDNGSLDIGFDITTTAANGNLGAGKNGIVLKNVVTADVDDNRVKNTGNDGIKLAGGSDIWVAGNHVAQAGNDGIAASGTDDLTIIGNHVRNVDSNGIAIDGGSSVGVIDNHVKNAGKDGIFASAVDALNIAYNRVRDSFVNGITIWNSDGATALSNNVNGAGQNGIEVDGSANVLVYDNHVKNVANDGIQASHTDSIHILANTVKNYGDDGIQVAYSTGTQPATDEGTGEDGGEQAQRSVKGADPFAGNGMIIIAGNTLTGNVTTAAPTEGQPQAARLAEGTDTTGIRLGDNDNNGNYDEATGASGDFSGVSNVIVSDNTINNNTTGLNATAFNNGYVDIDSNHFTDNTVGMRIGSGDIDLTHVTLVHDDATNTDTPVGNVFTGGDTAIIFSPSVAYFPGYNNPVNTDKVNALVEGGQEGEWRNASLRLAAENGSFDMSDLDNAPSLGHTVFSGQKTYYVDLENGAFFAPGTPTIIDGTLATWDGVPGGLMTPEQVLAINAKIHDYRDDNSLGLIFAGYADLDDNRILQKILGRNYGSRKASVTVLGLPHIGAIPAGEHFFSLQDLANIAPAAGGDTQGGNNDHAFTVAELAGIMPAAGNDNPIASGPIHQGACWGAMGGGNVTIDLSDDPTSIISAQAACK